MIWFFARGAHERRSCETRLAFDGVGCELVVQDEDRSRVEPFDELRLVLAREHDLLAAWRALGWRTIPQRRNRG